MGKVTYEFDENKESGDIELIVNRYWIGYNKLDKKDKDMLK